MIVTHLCSLEALIPKRSRCEPKVRQIWLWGYIFGHVLNKALPFSHLGSKHWIKWRPRSSRDTDVRQIWLRDSIFAKIVKPRASNQLPWQQQSNKTTPGILNGHRDVKQVTSRSPFGTPTKRSYVAGFFWNLNCHSPHSNHKFTTRCAPMRSPWPQQPKDIMPPVLHSHPTVKKLRPSLLFI